MLLLEVFLSLKTACLQSAILICTGRPTQVLVVTAEMAFEEALDCRNSKHAGTNARAMSLSSLDGWSSSGVRDPLGWLAIIRARADPIPFRALKMAVRNMGC